MIEIKTIGVWGFEGSLRGCRMPYESFDKSDSNYGCMEGLEEKKCKDYEYCPSCPAYGFVIGRADMALCKKLIKAGSEHRKFLRMIHVQADVTAPRYWWQEAETYQHLLHDPIFYVRNSSSTMHLITKRDLTMKDFSYNRVSADEVKRAIDEINNKIALYHELSDNDDKNEVFLAIKQMLPESYNQLRTIDTNYECLLHIYGQRKNHKLPEWAEFCSWLKSLPYMEEFINA